MISQTDEQLLRRAFELARRARDRGDEPFGALIAGRDGRVWVEADNTIHTSDDPTAHAETNALRRASGLPDPRQCTLYASTEPCAMCATAQVWAGVGRLVYGLPATRLAQLVEASSHAGPSIRLSCRQVFAQAQPAIEVVGPVLEAEAERVHVGYWGTGSIGSQPSEGKSEGKMDTADQIYADIIDQRLHGDATAAAVRDKVRELHTEGRTDLARALLDRALGGSALMPHLKQRLREFAADELAES